MKTLNSMKETIKEYIDPEATQVFIIGQKKEMLHTDYTIIKQIMNLDDACLLFGEYEIMRSGVSTHEEDSYNYPCIECVLNLNLE